MGLDTSHNAWHGPYSSFNNFRRWLAEKIGINLEDYIGYSSPAATKEITSIDHKLMVLFNHSDCEGDLTPEECKTIAEGIDEVLNFEPEEKPDRKDYNPFNNVAKAIQFRDGCLLAHSKNENLEFH